MSKGGVSNARAPVRGKKADSQLILSNLIKIKHVHQCATDICGHGCGNRRWFDSKYFLTFGKTAEASVLCRSFGLLPRPRLMPKVGQFSPKIFGRSFCRRLPPKLRPKRPSVEHWGRDFGPPPPPPPPPPTLVSWPRRSSSPLSKRGFCRQRRNGCWFAPSSPPPPPRSWLFDFCCARESFCPRDIVLIWFDEKTAGGVWLPLLQQIEGNSGLELCQIRILGDPKVVSFANFDREPWVTSPELEVLTWRRAAVSPGPQDVKVGSFGNFYSWHWITSSEFEDRRSSNDDDRRSENQSW